MVVILLYAIYIVFSLSLPPTVLVKLYVEVLIVVIIIIIIIIIIITTVVLLIVDDVDGVVGSATILPGSHLKQKSLIAA